MGNEIKNLKMSNQDQNGGNLLKLTLRELNLIYNNVFYVLDNSPFAVIFLNPSLEIKYVSPKLTEMLGYTIEDIPDAQTWLKISFASKKEKQIAEKKLLSRDNNDSLKQNFNILDKSGNKKIIQFTKILSEGQNQFIFFENLTEQSNYEQKIIESEEKFRSIVENSHAGIIIVHDDFLFSYVNEQFCKIIGYDKSELLGKDFRNFLHSSSIPIVSERYKKRQSGKKVPSEYIFKVVTKNGDVKTVQISSTITTGNSQKRPVTIAQILDITDKVVAEQKLIESESKYRKLFESASDAIFIMKDDRFIDCNSKTLDMFKCSKEEIIGQSPYKFSPSKQYNGNSSKKLALEKIKGAFNGVPQYFEWIHKKYSGEIFDAEVSLNKVEFDGENIIQAIVRDISERKKIERQLQLRSRIEKSINDISSTFISIPFELIDENITLALKRIVETISCDHGLIYSISEDHKNMRLKYSWVKEKTEIPNTEINIEDLKWWKSQILKSKAITTDNIDNLPKAAILEKKLFKTMGIQAIIDIPLNYKRKVIGVLRLISHDDSLNFQQTDLSLFNMVAQIFVNVFQRKKTEKDLRESEERLGLALSGAELGLWDWEVKTGKVTFNENWALILGYKPSEIKPHIETWQKLIHDEDYLTMRKALNLHLKGKTSFYESEYRIKTKSGKWKWILDRGKVFERDENGKPLRAAGTILDITDKKSAEEALIESEERFRSLFENSAFGIYQTSLDGKLELVNDSFLEIFGFESFDQIANKYTSKTFYLSKTDREKFLAQLLIDGKIDGSEVQYKNSKGELVYVREYARVVNLNGKTLIEGAIEDITEKKFAEKALVEAKNKAEESDKLKSEFLAQMSHEIRTPINTVLSFASLLKEELTGKLSSELDESFSIMNRAGRRIIRTIDLLLDMSQLQVGTYEIIPKKIDICDKILNEIAYEYQFIAKEKKLKFEIVKNSEQNIVMGDVYTIGQILQNLIDNAIKYTNKGYVKVIVDKDKNGKVFIKVSDSGIGISAEYIPNLFKPFTQEDRGYTRRYEGNGLGLALVKSYCELNNAEISVTSKKGKGTTFKIQFN